MTSTVLLDTNVFSAWLRPHSTLIPRYAKHVFGHRVAIAFQTVAEVRYGATAGWGREEAGRRRTAHPTHQHPAARRQDHVGGRAPARRMPGRRPPACTRRPRRRGSPPTAARWKLPLVAHDAVFLDCLGLELHTEIDA